MDRKITIYRLHPGEPRVRIEPASKDRDWMDTTDNKYAYRCLPLNIANQHGWAVYPTSNISAMWHGGRHIDQVEILNSGNGIAGSHFGTGILTLHLDHILKPSPGYSLYITGAPNYPKQNIIPLTGVYEADWAPYTFTMNWKFTEIGKVVNFSSDEPFCFVFPVERDLVESFSIEYKNIEEDEQLNEHYKLWSKKRYEFIEDTQRGPSAWQKQYFQGLYPDGQKCPFANHKTKLNLNK